MYCSKCGKQIDDDSIFCEHCGHRIAIDTHQDKSSKKSTIKVVSITVIIVSLIITVSVIYKVLNSDGYVIVTARDGSSYSLNIDKLNTEIDKLKQDWTIENTYGILLEDGQQEVKSVVVLKSNRIPNVNNISYYYASRIDIMTGNIENLDIQMEKSYGKEYVLREILSNICGINEDFTIMSY